MHTSQMCTASLSPSRAGSRGATHDGGHQHTVLEPLSLQPCASCMTVLHQLCGDSRPDTSCTTSDFKSRLCALITRGLTTTFGRPFQMAFVISCNGNSSSHDTLRECMLKGTRRGWIIWYSSYKPFKVRQPCTATILCISHNSIRGGSFQLFTLYISTPSQ
jgi:hypothetical protein